MQSNIKNITLSALFAALTAVCAQIAIPLGFSPVPFTLQVLAVCLSGAILGSKLGALSQIVYLLLGAVGVPVFAGLRAGVPILVGATGGYLLSYPLAAFFIGLVMERKSNYITAFLSMFCGLAIIYGMGVAQLKVVASLTWTAAYMGGAAPFILMDIIKILISAVVAVTVRHALVKSHLISSNL